MKPFYKFGLSQNLWMRDIGYGWSGLLVNKFTACLLSNRAHLHLLTRHTLRLKSIADRVLLTPSLGLCCQCNKGLSGENCVKSPLKTAYVKKFYWTFLGKSFLATLPFECADPADLGNLFFGQQIFRLLSPIFFHERTGKKERILRAVPNLFQNQWPTKRRQSRKKVKCVLFSWTFSAEIAVGGHRHVRLYNSVQITPLKNGYLKMCRFYGNYL